ncbi:MAG: DUF1460 domain-containing protein, partial [Phycisphaerales bacterium]|nr:DUF1460 domain-containing protein [Phycisphaerales bacterium]
MFPVLVLALFGWVESTQPSIDPPIYRMTPQQLHPMLPKWQAEFSTLNQRVIAIARANLGQPYELYLLGEAPFESIDNQPLFCLERSDCVVFVEHTLAMALSDGFPQFLKMLQRIRYAGGEIGVRTRNHFTEADWNRNNRWLLREITDQIAGPSVAEFVQKVDRAGFFKARYQIDVACPVEEIRESYVPWEKFDQVRSALRDGDVVNIVRGRGDRGWVGHVGFITIGPGGEVRMLHSASPQVREEPISRYIERATQDSVTGNDDG